MNIKMKETNKEGGEIVSVTKDAAGADVETCIGFYVNEAQEPQAPLTAKLGEVCGGAFILMPKALNSSMYSSDHPIAMSQFSGSERKEVLTKYKGIRDVLSDYPETPECLKEGRVIYEDEDSVHIEIKE